MKNGVYYWINLNRILIVSNADISYNEDASIIDWEDDWIITRRIFITARQYKLFMYLGEL